MSANLWKAENVISAEALEDGIYACSGTRGVRTNVTLDRLSANQTFHWGFSVNPGKDDNLNMGLCYRDAAGSVNYAWSGEVSATAGKWTRVSGSVVVPSGMTVYQMVICNNNNASGTSGWKVTNPTLSLGSPVCLASSAHTPYATQDHVMVTYATKSQLKVTDDSIKAEVSARARTDQNVVDLSSRLTQTANSLTSEISDRKSAITTVTGLANAAQSTADGAAKQANLYTIDNGDAGHVPKWIHLGTLTSAGDSSSATISIVFGNGYNGSAGQNSAMTITIKDGVQSTGSATKACGVTAMRENCDNALVDVLAQSATVYDVWVYAPWAYSNGRYSVSGQYAAWQYSGATQKTEPATSATQVKQDVAYRLADATKAQTMATENKSSIKQLSDSITSEVTERSKLAGRVGTLESTSGTHTSKLEQLAASITSLVKGESTYTDPDGKSATSGIYSLVEQTRDSVTALFGSYTKTADMQSQIATAKSQATSAANSATDSKLASYTKTADLASTQAVKDAKKAGTDAQAAASAAQTTADSASSTAGAAKSTADSLATMIREDATGITVGKSADGKTYSTGRTRMTDSAFEVLDKAGAVIAQLAGDGVSFLSGLVRIVAGKVSLPGADSVDSITIDAGGGVATVSGLISRLSGLYNGISSTVTAGFATYGGNGITATVRDTKSNIVANAILGVDEATVGIGGQYVKMKGDAFEFSHPEYLLAALMDASKVPESLDTCGPGVFSYDTSTTSRPTDYGTCVCIRAGDSTSTWLFEFALPTVGDPYWRRNINGAGWTSWWTITSQ